MKKHLDFYFDVISPYAWLAFGPVKSLCIQKSATFRPVPVLFAGLLNHHGQKGPAEIPAKRIYLMNDVSRRATARGLLVNPPPTHPFNPLLPLRILCACDPSKSVALSETLLNAIWVDGKDLSSTEIISNVLNEAGYDSSSLLSASKLESTKLLLKENTAEAINRGVFGVPTAVTNNELFWGSELDTFQHIEAALDGKSLIQTVAVDKWKNLEPSASRRK